MAYMSFYIKYSLTPFINAFEAIALINSSILSICPLNLFKYAWVDSYFD
jgi:hypothetical protein